MNTVIVLLLVFPIVFLLSILFDGIDRKVHARMQNRIGPPIVQPFYDFIKLFNKERIVPITASSEIFTLVPVIAAAASVLGASIPLSNLLTKTNVGGDLILTLYLLAMSSVMIMIGGSSSGNPYGAVGFSRKMTMLIAYEMPMLMSILSISLNLFSLSYYDIVLTQIQIKSPLAFASPSMIAAAATFLLCIPAATDVVPFDISEAKTEIIHGSLVEYGGAYLAFVKLAKASSNFALTFLAASLFFYIPALFEGLWQWGHLLLCLITAFVFMLVTITIPRTIFARVKIGQAFKFYLFIPLALAVLSLTLSILGL